MKFGCIPIFYCAFFLCLFVIETQAQQVTLSGYVEDAKSGERLVGATLYEANRGVGTVTNTYGFFSLTLPPGNLYLRVSYVGYRTDTLAISLDRNEQVTLELEPSSVELEEVEVTADREPWGAGVSSVRVPVEQIQQIPALMGEVDLLKALQLLPGVKSGMEGTGGLYVRGGSQDQNLILLDGTPVFNASHLFGFLSVFNAAAVKNITLIKGGFPARYGGRLSSVVEITMKEGNMKKRSVEGSIGLVTSRLMLEAPLWKDRTSVIFSGRRTYFDLLVRPFTDYESGKPTAYFYDANAKINHVFSRKDRLYLSLYTGEDRFGADNRDDFSENTGRLGWGNTTAALRWNHLWSPKLFMNSTLTYSDFGLAVRYDQTQLDSGEIDAADYSGARYRSGIDALGVRIDLDWIPAPRHYGRTGAGVTSYLFNPGALELRGNLAGDLPDEALVSRQVRALEGIVYAEDDLSLSTMLKINIGVHASAFLVESRMYGSVQPRLSAQYLVGQDWTLRTAYSTMQQYIHLLSHTSGLGLPTDLWVPATDRIRPQKAWQASLGVSRAFRQNRYELSLESYYKHMNGLITYREGASYLTPGTDWQDLVVSGDGWSYGIEVFLQRMVGRTTGWIGYTLSRTMRQFDKIGNGLAFPDRYDRRHDISFVLSHRLSDRLDLSVTWVYGTGNAVTLPVAYYYTYGHGTRETVPFEYYGERRNSFRMPAYHRLDLGVSYYFARRDGRENALTLSVYNAYNRKNPFYLERDGFHRFSDRVQKTLKAYAVFPIIPSISYSFRY